ncbi:lysophospholipase D GDPD3a isoform X2 [Denticeps clupeoides]|uniref:lysophospholipase D GDPD3a isoform X2 n=1 Tax=Denticeps clupeoides TaxID=299321 RepID=UPI0010A4F8B5|nr:lysophospholipase D GDPD3-like isoform X2 [Denticeps clupeoides]
MASYMYYILPAVGGYTLTSLYLLKNPHILHKKKETSFRCRHISHRGGCGERIENTMEAFTHATQQGTEMLELDCHLTRDGQVIVSHDENLLRQTGQDITVSTVNFNELPLYKESLEVTFNTGRNHDVTDVRCVPKVSALVKQYHREDITVWASSSNHIMSKCRAKNPCMPYMFSMKRGIQLLLLFYSGLLPFVPLGESFLQFYLPCIFNRTYIPDMPILRNQMVVYLIEKLTIRKSLFDHLVKRGIQIHLFVCNEEQDIETVFTVGATGVMTDYPTLLRNYFIKQGQET